MENTVDGMRTKSKNAENAFLNYVTDKKKQGFLTFGVSKSSLATIRCQWD